MTTTLIILVLLLFLSYICSKEDLFSPGVLTCAIWLVCLILWQIIPHPKLPDLGTQFVLALSLWVCFLCLGTLSAQSIHYPIRSFRSSSSVREVYFWISLACLPLLMLFALNALRTGTSTNWAMNLRMAAVGKGSANGSGEAYTPFYYLLWIVTYLLYLIDADRHHWKHAFISGALVLLFAIVTMSKTLILNFGLMTLFIFYVRGQISVRHILIGIIVLAIGMMMLHGLRQNHQVNEQYTSHVVEQYILRNFPAFETLTPCSSEHNGEHVFRLYYAVTYRLGLSDIEPINPILPWVNKPIFTNTYTTLYPFFLDYGYVGVAVAALLIGLLIGWIFKCHQQGSQFFTLLYAYFFVMLITQYNGDTLMTNLAGNIKLIIILAIPFLVGGYQEKVNE